MYPYVHPTPHGAADPTVAQQLALLSRERAHFHARMAGLFENLAGICRGAAAPGEAAKLMLSTGHDIPAVLRQLDDAATCCVLAIQTWQRELVQQAQEDARRAAAKLPPQDTVPGMQ